MSNLSQEEMQKRGELIKRARQILIQEYTAMRNQRHQQWLRESAMTWKTKGLLIAYPSAKMYPTEQEVVDKALDLFNRSNQPIATVSTTPTELPIEPTPVIQVTDIESPILYQDAITPSITEQLQAAYNAPLVTHSIVEMTPTVPTTTDIVQAGGDFVIIDEPIELNVAGAVTESIEETIAAEPIEETAIVQPTEVVPTKHSLLRSVLSGWLSKNKDKENLK